MEKLIDWTRAIDLKKVLRYFGLSDDENTENAQVTLNRSELYYPSIADELSYKYYDEKSQIFINEDSAGLLYRISPLTGANEAVAEQLDTILRNKVSHELTLQLIKVTHNQLGPQIDRFAAQFKRKEFKDLSKLGQSLEDYYKRAAREGFATRNGVKARLTHSEVYLVVDFATRGKTEKDIRLFFDRFKVSFQAALTASSIGFENCNAVDLLHVLYLYLRHTPKAVYPATVNYQEDQLLKYQVVDNAFSLEVDSQTKDHLILRGDHQIIDPEDPTKFEVEPFETEVSVLSLDKVPSSFQLWNNINNIDARLFRILLTKILLKYYQIAFSFGDHHGSK